MNLAKTWLMVLGGAVLLACLVAGPTNARAMCVYNDNAYEWVGVSFDCGFACFNSWEYVYQGQHVCRPGKGGTVTVYFNPNNDTWKCAVKVDEHGWVSIVEHDYGALTEYTVTSKHSNGSVDHVCTFGE